MLSACSTTPPYQAPSAPATSTFKETGVWQSAHPQAAAVPGDCWLRFNDPVLNDLQTRVGNNQNLLASAAPP